jgi:Flp pilus assembly pilin Flp
MKNVLKKFWNDEAGFVVTVEIVLVSTILVIGLAAGLVGLRSHILAELADTANAIGSINQSYAIAGYTFDGVAVQGATVYNDAKDGEAHPAALTAGLTLATDAAIDGEDGI